MPKYQELVLLTSHHVNLLLKVKENYIKIGKLSIPGNTLEDSEDELESFFCYVLIQTQGIISVVGNICKGCFLIWTFVWWFTTQSEKDNINFM